MGEEGRLIQSQTKPWENLGSWAPSFIRPGFGKKLGNRVES